MFVFGSGKPHATVCCLFHKLHQSQLELQEARLSYRQLQGKVEELTEERSLQSCAATSTSLLSEIEQSMEAEELEQEREQVLLSCRSGMCEVAQGLQGRPWTAGACPSSLWPSAYCFCFLPARACGPASASLGLLARAVGKQALTKACPGLTVAPVPLRRCLLARPQPHTSYTDWALAHSPSIQMASFHTIPNHLLP